MVGGCAHGVLVRVVYPAAVLCCFTILSSPQGLTKSPWGLGRHAGRRAMGCFGESSDDVCSTAQDALWLLGHCVGMFVCPFGNQVLLRQIPLVCCMHE